MISRFLDFSITAFRIEIKAWSRIENKRSVTVNEFSMKGFGILSEKLTSRHSIEKVCPRRRGHIDLCVHLEGFAIIRKEIKICKSVRTA